MVAVADDAADGALWRWGKGGRWRSSEWLQWVREQPCCCGMAQCPNCGGWAGRETVEAAHWRYGAACGLGRKPDDFMVYPLSWSQHRIFHGGGQPPHAVQYQWVRSVWARALGQGILESTVARVGRWLARPPPELPAEEVVLAVRAMFRTGALRLRHPFFTSIPF